MAEAVGRWGLFGESLFFRAGQDGRFKTCFREKAV
jgi:hypothetical protein